MKEKKEKRENEKELLKQIEKIREEEIPDNNIFELSEENKKMKI